MLLLQLLHLLFEQLIALRLAAHHPDELLDQLEALGDSSVTNVSEDLRGHPLPCPYDEADNGYERSTRFRARTCHGKPRLMGDTANADVADRLEAIARRSTLVKYPEGKWAEAYEHEVRSLVPALSYLHDLRAHAVSTVAGKRSRENRPGASAAARPRPPGRQ